jgi:deoxyadenosine/deoxycytidine kinase
MAKIISIDGNIGSGKSTLLHKLKEYIHKKYKDDITRDNKIIFLQEPVDQWLEIKDKDGKDILTNFYENPVKYSFAFQMMAYISRLSLLKKCISENPDAIIITERCLNTDRYVFAKMLYDDGKLDEIEYQIYLRWFNDFIDLIKVQKTVYLKTCPSICYERINKRKRDGEDNISIEYLTNCHKYHQDMIEYMYGEGYYKEENSNILVINSDIDFSENNGIMDSWINQIFSFI